MGRCKSNRGATAKAPDSLNPIIGMNGKSADKVLKTPEQAFISKFLKK